MAKYTDKKYQDHLKLKSGHNKNVATSAKHDPLLDAAQRRKPDQSKLMNRPEVGVSIQVGIKEGEDVAAEAVADSNDAYGDEGGPVFIEDPFGDEPY